MSKLYDFVNCRLQNLQTNCFFGLDEPALGGDLVPLFEEDTVDGTKLVPLLRSFETISMSVDTELGLKYKSLLKLRNSLLTTMEAELVPGESVPFDVVPTSLCVPSKLAFRTTG